MSKNLKGALILLLCAFIWGMAFTAQTTAMDHIGAYGFTCLRFAMASACLFALCYLRREKPDKAMLRRHWPLGILLGVILLAAALLQQIGLKTTTTAKSGFVTALYIVIIPLIGLLRGQRHRAGLYIGVGMSLLGMVLLCLGEGFSLCIGDLLTLLCAFVFAFHIITVDEKGGSMDSVLLSAIQFAAAALICLPLMLLFEGFPTGEALSGCMVAMLYAGICSGAGGYTLQLIGQKYADPTVASLLMCLEAVFSALGGWVLLGQVLSLRELLGCAIMLAASVVALLSTRNEA